MKFSSVQNSTISNENRVENLIKRLKVLLTRTHLELVDNDRNYLIPLL